MGLKPVSMMPPAPPSPRMTPGEPFGGKPPVNDVIPVFVILAAVVYILMHFSWFR
jgi:hypothetical protein